MLELYFPHDKSAYIPAALELIIFMLAAFITVRLTIIYSRREEKRAEELEEKLKLEEKNWNS